MIIMRKTERIRELKEEIQRLEKHLGQLLYSKIARSGSYEKTAVNVKAMIEQKRKEIAEIGSN